jgi:hypothetical protein
MLLGRVAGVEWLEFGSFVMEQLLSIFLTAKNKYWLMRQWFYTSI